MMAADTHTTEKTMARPAVRTTSKRVSTPAPRVRVKKIGLETQLEKRLHAAVLEHGNNYELGQRAGVPADVLSRFSRRERNLRLDTAGRLAVALGLTLADEE
jgi:hypothetical protein